MLFLRIFSLFIRPLKNRTYCVYLQKTAKELNELENPALKNVVVANRRILCQLGTLCWNIECESEISAKRFLLYFISPFHYYYYVYITAWCILQGREMDTRTTVYKKKDASYQLKMKASRRKSYVFVTLNWY